MFEPLNILLRVVLALIFLFASTKFLTKRSLSNLTYFDYIATVTLGTLAGNLAFNIKIHILNFIFSMALITLIIMLASYISLKHKPLRSFLAGEPTILIQNGKILEQNMINLNYSYDYLNQQLRQQSIFNIAQVKLAVLEPNGKLSVQLKSQNQPLTPKDLSLLIKYKGLATEMVLDGKIIERNLEQNGLTPEWLHEKLREKGIDNITKVTFAALSTNGNLYVDLSRD